jgi:hypothetical protein
VTYKLHTQTFLEKNSLEDLTAQLGINVKPHPKYPELVHLSYNQLESPKDNPVVQECRGLILNSKKQWKVEAFPFKRFANQGETWAAPIDWSSVRVQEKVDGSLMIVWWYGGVWNVSTKGSPDAGGTVGDQPFTFNDLFWQTLQSGYPGAHMALSGCIEGFHPWHTYMIELTSLHNRVVCLYGSKPALTLIGIRDLRSEGYPEIPVKDFTNSRLPIVKEYPLTTVDEIVSAAEALDPMQNEGFVVVDKFHNRVKIKSPSYVMIHHMKDGFGQRRMIRLIQLGESSEVLSYFPEYQEMFDEVQAKVEAMLVEIETDFDRIKHLTDRKDFALEATKSKHSGVLFALYLGKATSVREYVLFSKRVIRKATATEPAVEDFQFSEQKIEQMAGLKERKELTLET